MAELVIDAERLRSELATLASYTEPGSRGVTRRLGSRVYRESRQWVASRMAEAGLRTRISTAANLIGRREGRGSLRSVLLVGSHTDTVVDGGAFDGALGVLAAIEASRALREADIELFHPLEVVDFLAEEVTDFGISAVGSRAMAGTFQRDWLALCDTKGVSLGETMASIGGNPDRLADAACDPGSIAAYLELHIEQGPQLWNQSTKIGIVSGIVAVRRYRAVITGQADHAGTTPMMVRRDALPGAADVVLLIERLCRAAGEPIVGTVGQIAVSPNVSNVIAGSVEFVFEVRGPDEGQLNQLSETIVSEADALATSRGLHWQSVSSGFVPAVTSSAQVVDAIEQIAQRRGYSQMRLYSGAGHDASHIAGIAPIGMVFVPCRDGRSHCPEEYVSPEDIAPGVDVLAHTLLELDRQLP